MSFKEAFKDPRFGKWSIGRVLIAWVVVIQTNIMTGLSAAGLFPPVEAVKLILGLVSGPAIIYLISTYKAGGKDGNTDTAEADPDSTSRIAGVTLEDREISAQEGGGRAG